MSPRDRGAKDAAEQRAAMIGLGLAVERLRLESKLTRDAVAKGGGLTGGTITDVEKALKKEVRWETIRALARGLKVKPQDLQQLALELAPGRGGERLRQQAREARDIDIEAFIAEVTDEEKKLAQALPRRDRPRRQRRGVSDFDVEALIAEAEEQEQQS